MAPAAGSHDQRPRRRRLRRSQVTAIVAALVGCGAVEAINLAERPTGDPATYVAAMSSRKARASTSSNRVPLSPKPLEVRHVLTPPPIKPRIVWDPIPFGAKRKAETAAYAERHYGLHSYKLINPHVIVIHYTDGPSFQSAYNTFAPDMPDSELHELPGTCAHFVIDTAGVIHQLVSLGIICRHTVGLNWTAIGIEHVGYSDRQILDNPRELGASLRLVRWLRCRLHITITNVIGHNESLSSPYHHERVPSLHTQTHGDWVHANMQIYRHRLRRLGGCPAARLGPQRRPFDRSRDERRGE
jgi:N-acetylmuramoyl-L-alanine amidase